MSVVTCAKLYGNVSCGDIADFLKASNHDVADVKAELTESVYADADYIKEYYRDDHKNITQSGYVQICFSDGHDRQFFYCKSSVNSYENLKFYSENYPELVDMVKSETTYISMGHDEEAEALIYPIVEHFGGWYQADDCSCEYKKIARCGHKRIDIMTDIETLGKTNDPPVFQISACAFDISTGDILETFDNFANIKTYNNIEGDTLLWWLKTNKELLTTLLQNGVNSGKTEKDIVSEFVSWIKRTASIYDVSPKDVYLWGNGILFDNRILSEKCEKYDIKYPIFYRNDRDMRTIVELASIKTGCKDTNEYRNKVPMLGTAHNAIDDTTHQIDVVVQAYKDLLV